MRSRRSRYVTVCQQSLVTAAVLVVAVSAAGVRTLDIVPAPGAPGAPVGSEAAGAFAPDDATVLRERERRTTPEPATVDTAPVTPEVREVAVTGVKGPAGGTPAPEVEAAEPRTAVPETASPEPTRLVARSQAQPVEGYATVGVTWSDREYEEDQISVEVRTKDEGRWSGWSAAEYHDEHAPEPAEAAAAASRAERPGTDALVVGDVDAVQMRTLTSDGSTPPDLELAVIDPGEGATDVEEPALDTATLPGAAGSAPAASEEPAGTEQATTSSVPADATASLSAMRVAPKPQIFSRAQWGANERLRGSAPSYGTVKTGFIHHTVNANNYSEADVPSLMRGIYAYHTQSRGWSDLGYNFLVDRFGRIWEGRYGGVDRAVVGAHTLGYNEASFAMSAIGNFDVAQPPQAVVNAYAALMAWKLSLHDVRADATRLYVKNKYFNGINGHRDAGSTACPGRYLYAKLPEIRAAAARIQDGAAPAAPAPSPSPSPTPAPSTTFTSPTQTPRAAKPQPAGSALPRHPSLVGTAYPDVVLRQKGTGTVKVLPTEGQTGLGAATSTPVDWAGKVDLLAATGDVTGDGLGDVVARAVKGSVLRVYRGDGKGRINPVGFGATSMFSGADLVVGAGDWDRDGRNDLLVRTRSTGALSLARGLGNGRFADLTVLGTGWQGATSVAPGGDLNSDGRPDLVAVRSGVLYVVPGTSTGRLGSWVRSSTSVSAYDAVVGAARDLSGDAKNDLYVRTTSGSLSVLTGNASGGFGPTLGGFAGGAGLQHLSAGAMSGSWQPDLVGLADGGTRLVVVPHNGRRNGSTPVTTNVTLAGASQVFAAGDWNRDGRGDLITRQYAGDTLKLRPGLGNGRFALPVRMSKGWATFTSLAAVGDVTGDGRPDLLGRTAKGRPTIFPGNGGTGFQAPILAPAALRTFNQVGTGSFEPGSMPGSTFVSPDGSFVPFVGAAGSTVSGYAWTVGPGDVDGDGRPDLVARDAAGVVWLLPGTTSGVGARRYLAGGYGSYDLGG